MWSAKDTNNLRHSLKFKLSQYSWYISSSVIPGFEGYDIQVDVSRLDDKVKRLVPSHIKGTSIKLNLKSGYANLEDSEL